MDTNNNQNDDSNDAADLIRHKLNSIYNEEPDAKEEIAEVSQVPDRTEHQQFMFELSNSGKDLAAIQTEWHNYYKSLPDHQKHQVWQEFYSSQPFAGMAKPSTPAPTADENGVVVSSPIVPNDAHTVAKHKQQAASGARGNQKNAEKRQKMRDARTPDEVKSAIRDKVTAGGKLKVKHQLQSLFFGLGVGSVVLIIFLFSFFNQIVIAPFIQPSRAHADTPIIIGNSSVAPTADPEVIIPKINVEAPINFSETSTDESSIENDLQSAVVHYPTTSEPGQTGNAAFFGHSSNNIFNKGKYKFIFVYLHTLVKGDTFYITYNNKVYVYKVTSTAIVPPSDVAVLNPVAGQTATATLITCDPPGTSINRFVVVGQQISPDPTSDAAATTTATNTSTGSNTTLPNDGQSAAGKFLGSVFGKFVVVILIIALIIFIVRRTFMVPAYYKT